MRVCVHECERVSERVCLCVSEYVSERERVCVCVCVRVGKLPHGQEGRNIIEVFSFD